MKKEYGIAFIIIAITGLAFVTLSGSVFSGYHFMDCSDYIKWEKDLSEMSWVKCLVKHIDSESGLRFRPAWHLNILSKTLLWGDNMLLNGFWQIFLNSIAAFLIYLLGRGIKWTHYESLLLAGISLIGAQSAIFYQTLAIETPALIILLISWYFILKFFNSDGNLRKTLSYIGFILFSLLVVLMKENFILVLPASYLLYCTLYSEKHHTGFAKTIVNTLKTGILLFLVTAACLWAVLTFAGNDFGYAGIGTSISLLSYFKSAIYLYVISGCILAFFGLFYLYCNKKAILKEYLFPVFLFLMITVPQIIIYGKSNIVDRYLIPAVVGCAYFSIFIYREIKKHDKPVNELIWKNSSLFLGVIITIFCGLIVFSKTFQQEIIRFAVQLQGQVIQTMTSVSSLQYLTNTLSIIGATGLIIGFVLLLLGAWRSNHLINSVSRLYITGLLLILFMNGGLAFASCKRYAMRGFATENFLKTIINHSRTDDIILVAGNPWVDMEGVTSGIYEYLHKQNRQNLYVYPVTENQQQEEFISWVKDFYHQKDIHAIENKEIIQVVALFPGSENVFITNSDWFEVNSFNKYEFTGNYVVYARK